MTIVINHPCPESKDSGLFLKSTDGEKMSII